VSGSHLALEWPFEPHSVLKEILPQVANCRQREKSGMPQQKADLKESLFGASGQECCEIQGQGQKQRPSWRAVQTLSLLPGQLLRLHTGVTSPRTPGTGNPKPGGRKWGAPKGQA
jgi:hypothetical protein